jgi:hypothetical protein
MTCDSNWNVLVIRACDATMAARIAIISDGHSMCGGTVSKKGFAYAAGMTEM